ncbi:MAG: tetratricopeptide repeat protein [Gammaproteobacteria bacterium]
MMKFIPRIVVISSCFLMLSACGTLATRDDQYVVETDGTTKVRPQAGTSKAVLALLAQARSAAMEGQLARSEAFLERALRIEPRNPVLWHYMAKLRLNEGRLKQAAGLAAKSNSLDRDNKILQADNWRIIAHARHKQGDIDGARRAQARVDELLSGN